ncbi:MAG: alpha-hydroxy-acid oxidizing protein [Bacteroidota bacterium]|nr:alpha-hydroxy-acid oxidizing protein [Bacteroidota bacterium]
MMPKAIQRQKEIFQNGSIGIKSKIPVEFLILESNAQKILSPKAFAYIATGAGSETGMRNNSDAFSNYSILPKMAHGLNGVNYNIELLGTNSTTPFMFAPIGVLDLAYPKGDIEVAKAAKVFEIPMIFSNQASTSMEECSTILGDSPHWFQLYFSKSKELVESFIQRAEQSNCKAIVLTLDTTLLGWRPRDLNNAYLPFIEGLGIAQYTSDPYFQSLLRKKSAQKNSNTNFHINQLFLLHKLVRNYPGNYFSNLISKDAVSAVRTFVDLYTRPNLSWEDVSWLKSITKLPLILKGILRSDDAKKAIDCGADGIVVSNHGGRQIDHVISSLDALIDIRKNIPKNFPLMIDSGIRKAADIFISLALGANAVLIGRPYVYALAIDGSRGVQDYISNLNAEFELIMHLSGCSNLKDINSDMILKKE